MFALTSSATQIDSVTDLLLQVRTHGTPLRIEGETETYYVLSAEQLLALFDVASADIDSVGWLEPHDFGLTQEDLTAYETRRKERRTHLLAETTTSLDADLEDRLRRLARIQRQHPLSQQQMDERERLLGELETAVLRCCEL